jgi:hypothetical protein
VSYQIMLRELRAKIVHENDPETLLSLVEQLLKLLAQRYDKESTVQISNPLEVTTKTTLMHLN